MTQRRTLGHREEGLQLDEEFGEWVLWLEDLPYRRRILLGAKFIAAVMLFVCGILGEGSGAWLLGGVVCAVLLAFAEYSDQQVRSLEGAQNRARAALRDEVQVASLVEYSEGVNGALTPIAKYLSELIDCSRDEKLAKIGTLTHKVVEASVSIADAATRGAYYKLNGGTLVREAFVTSTTEPRASFKMGSADLRAMMKIIGEGKPRYTEDILTVPKVSRSAGANYRTVYAVPIRAGDRPYGILTVDAVPVDALLPSERVLISALGALLGVGSAVRDAV